MKKTKYDPLEKLSFFSGMLIITALVGYLGLQWATQDKVGPRLLVHCQYTPSLSDHGYHVEIENIGDGTAEAVKIEFGLFHNGKMAGTAGLDIQFIPAKSREKGQISFSGEIQKSDSLAVISMSFLKP